jgi:UDP-glucose 4-epimerase
MSKPPMETSSSQPNTASNAQTNANTSSKVSSQQPLMNPKQFLVTGGCGFIGGHFVDKLMYTYPDAKIMVVDDLRTPGNYRVEGVEYLNESIQDAHERNALLEWDFDYIFHLGNTPRVRRAIEFPAETIDNNVTSTTAVCEIGLRCSAQVYFAQSSSIQYEDTVDNAYTLSKIFCDDILNLYQFQYGLNVTKMFFYSVYGPREADYGPYSTVVKRFSQRVESDEVLEIYGDGNKTRDFTHVEDVTRNMIDMLDEIGFIDEIHFGKGDPRRIQEIADGYHHPTVYKFNMPGEAQDTHCIDGYGDYDYDVIEYITEWVKGRSSVH